MVSDRTMTTDGWPVRELSILCSRITDGSHFSPRHQKTGYPIGNVKDMTSAGIDLATCTRINAMDYARLVQNGCAPEQGDILLSKDGTIGKVVVWSQKTAIVLLSSIAILRPTTDVHSHFLSHLLQSDFFRTQLISFQSGSALKRLVLRDIAKLRFPHPSLPEQDAIAAILDTVDEAIRQTAAVIEKFKKIKAGLLHDLLTCGIDENGQLRNPIRQPEEFKDSLIGKLPKVWEVKPMLKAAVRIQDGTHFSPHSKSGPYLYLTSRNVKFGTIDLTDAGHISAKEHQFIYSGCPVQYGDVLLPKDGVNTGNAALNVLPFPFSLLSSVAFIRSDEKTLHGSFLLQFLLSPTTQRRLKDQMSGNAIPRITVTKIEAFLIPVPPSKEQLAIVRFLEAHDERLQKEEEAYNKLILIKQGLMQDLLTGRVRVPGTKVREKRAT